MTHHIRQHTPLLVETQAATTNDQKDKENGAQLLDKTSLRPEKYGDHSGRPLHVFCVYREMSFQFQENTG